MSFHDARNRSSLARRLFDEFGVARASEMDRLLQRYTRKRHSNGEAGGKILVEIQKAVHQNREEWTSILGHNNLSENDWWMRSDITESEKERYEMLVGPLPRPRDEGWYSSPSFDYGSTSPNENRSTSTATLLSPQSQERGSVASMPTTGSTSVRRRPRPARSPVLMARKHVSVEHRESPGRYVRVAITIDIGEERRRDVNIIKMPSINPRIFQHLEDAGALDILESEGDRIQRDFMRRAEHGFEALHNDSESASRSDARRKSTKADMRYNIFKDLQKENIQAVVEKFVKEVRGLGLLDGLLEREWGCGGEEHRSDSRPESSRSVPGGESSINSWSSF
ncbi:hypothetical protein DENSPDRAFT_283946 [Dentipellis sp. KUC8613]|nr:hypothetical protein DENSPDRAFT_283946 [Dentipellis sp. KUC8613]